jgi:hypothetical protein
MALPKRPKRDREGGGNTFLKLAAGETASGVFRGDPRFFYSKWVGGKGVETDAEDPDGRERFRMNFVMKENGVYTAKIFEASGLVYDDLSVLDSQGYDLFKTPVSIKRQGEGKQTRYVFLPVPGGELEGDKLALVANAELKDLANKPAKTTTTTPKKEEDIPF